MKNEETTYENEGTTLDGTQVNSGEARNDAEGTNETEDDNKNKSTFRKAATGVGAGILLGSIASFGFSSAANAATGEAEDDGNGNHNPAWADDSVDIAASVSDDMTFSQAFAAARAEVGPGGAFEWQGNVYGTYTAEEWGNMTPEEKEEYNSQFSWSQHHGTSNSSAEESSENTSEVSPEEPIKEPVADRNEASAVKPVDESAEEQIEVVSVEPEDTATDSASHATDDVPVAADDETSDVEILGVVHDGESGANIGEMMVDGQEVFLIDVDGEGKFDYMATDLNHDGQIAQEEFADISAENIAVHQFDNSLNEDAMYASNGGETDYINDDVIA